MSVKVKFISEIEVKDGKKTLKAAKNANIKIDSSCEGKGKCGKCLVRVLSGKLSEPTKQELKALGQEKIDEGYRLSCQTQILEDSVIEIINKNEIKTKKDNIDNKKKTKEDIESEIKDGSKAKAKNIKSEIKDNSKTKVKEGIKSEIKDDSKAKAKEDIKSEIKDSSKTKVKEDIKLEIKDNSKVKAKNDNIDNEVKAKNDNKVLVKNNKKSVK